MPALEAVDPVRLLLLLLLLLQLLLLLLLLPLPRRRLLVGRNDAIAGGHNCVCVPVSSFFPAPKLSQ